MSFDWTPLMKEAGVELAPGLDEAELKAIEEGLGFTFPPDLRGQLATSLPVSDGFPDWRQWQSEEILDWMDEPIDGVCFDVEENGFWLPSWGEKPDDVDDASELARSHLARAPILIPIFGHRYLPSRPAQEGNPIFSIVQSDVIVFARDLEHLCRIEFANEPIVDINDATRIEVWSELADHNR